MGRRDDLPLPCYLDQVQRVHRTLPQSSADFEVTRAEEGRDFHRSCRRHCRHCRPLELAGVPRLCKQNLFLHPVSRTGSPKMQCTNETPEKASRGPYPSATHTKIYMSYNTIQGWGRYFQKASKDTDTIVQYTFFRTRVEAQMYLSYFFFPSLTP